MRGNYPDNRFRKKRGFFFLPVIALCLLLSGFVVRWLWNAILPEVTGVRPLSFWQALGLLVLCRILFGRFDFKRGGERRQWRRDFRDKWRNMSDDDRKRFREEWEKRCRF
ncbi:MAG: hypothetical protein QM610_07140 [Chitinophagaceae bacterium]